MGREAELGAPKGTGCGNPTGLLVGTQLVRTPARCRAEERAEAQLSPPGVGPRSPLPRPAHKAFRLPSHLGCHAGRSLHGVAVPTPASSSHFHPRAQPGPPLLGHVQPWAPIAAACSLPGVHVPLRPAHFSADAPGWTVTLTDPGTATTDPHMPRDMLTPTDPCLLCTE